MHAQDSESTTTYSAKQLDDSWNVCKLVSNIANLCNDHKDNSKLKSPSIILLDSCCIAVSDFDCRLIICRIEKSSADISRVASATCQSVSSYMLLAQTR